MIHSLCTVIGHHRRPGRRPGQAMLEFALALPLLCLLIFGVLDAGRAVVAQIALTNAAAISVRFAALQCSALTASACAASMQLTAPVNVNGCPDSLAEVCSTISAAAFGADTSQITLTLTLVPPIVDTDDGSISVFMTDAFHAATPLIDNALGGGLVLSAGASALVNR